MSDLWYKKLPDIPNIENILYVNDNDIVVGNAGNKGSCLKMNKNSTNGFTISSYDCSNKLRVVCKLTQSSEDAKTSGSSLPQIQCISKQNRRRKRESDMIDDQNTFNITDEKGIFVDLGYPVNYFFD